MRIQYGDIRDCELFQNDKQFLLIAPQGTDQNELIRNGFVQMADGSWHHYLTAQEFQYIRQHWNDEVILLQVAVRNGEETPEDRHRAHILCFVSLGLLAGSWAIGAISAVMLSRSEGDYADTIMELIYGVCGLCNLGAFVTMIVTRVKYPNSRFGKILMWCYIGYLILQVILVVAVIIACSVGFAMCLNELQGGCPG